MTKEKKESRKTGQKKQPAFFQACITILLSAGLLFGALVCCGAEPPVPLFFCTGIAGIMAAFLGYTWEEILKAVTDSVSQAIEAILILCLIGILVGCWIGSGTVPVIICYGLRMIRAPLFLPAAAVFCAVLSYLIGAWGTVGTVGLALMGIGLGLKIPAPQAAGAILTGAYLGEVISPFSDATNFTAAVIGKDVFTVTRRTFRPAAAGFLIAVVLFFFLGKGYAADAAQTEKEIAPLLESISGSFRITPLALLPLVLMIMAILLKVPAIPSILVGIVSAAVLSLTVQKIGPAELLQYCAAGYESHTGNSMADTLLTAGGLESMLFSISVILSAMSFGGIMNATGQMEALIRPICRRIRSSGVLNAVVTVTCVLMNIVMPDQYLAISLPGQMFRKEYEKRGIDLPELSGTLLMGGAVTSPVVPWNTCGIYCSGILGVPVLVYMRFSLISFLFPLICILEGWARSVRRRNAER